MTRLVVFDCDGTLVDSQRLIIAAMHATFDGAALTRPGDETVRRVVGLSLDEAIARLAPAAPEAAVAQMTREYKDHYARLSHDPAIHDGLYPGARAMLARLEAAGYLLAVATGKSRRGLDGTLRRHQLGDFFVSLRTADDGPGKPHPAMLEGAMAEAGARADETALVGDTVYDMEMARNAGTRAIGVSWGYHAAHELRAAGAATVLSSFDELPAALAR